MLGLIFLVCLAASAVGGICGIGGGVIIKPVLDAMGVMSVSAISFLSGLTVLSMSVISVVRQRGQRQVELRTGSLLALGAVAGGIAGNWVFHLVKNAAGQDAFVGMVQSAVLALVTLLTLVYSAWLRRARALVPVHSAAACVAIGGGMGVLSAFLGIGGGPHQSGGAVFCLFHGHEEGGSQLPVHHHVLPGVQLCDLCDPGDDTLGFPWTYLLAMVPGGVLGGLLGSRVNRHLSVRQTDQLFSALLCVIILICIYNVRRFASV